MSREAMADYEELPSYHRQPRASNGIHLKPWCLCLVFLTLAISVFFLWPRQVGFHAVDVQSRRLNVNTSSGVHLDADLTMRIQLNNPNFFSIRYDKISLYLIYRGEELGNTVYDSSRSPARSSVLFTAHGKVERFPVVNHVQLVSDVSGKSVPVIMTADFSDHIGIFEGTVYCYLYVDPSNNEISHKDCRTERPEMSEHPLLSLLAKSKFSMSNWYMIALVVVAGLLVLLLVVFILWPRIPEIGIEDFKVQGLSTDSKFSENSYIPEVTLDLGFSLVISIRNRNFVGVTYEKITVYVFYCGYELCRADLNGGEIAARETSTIETNLNLRGAEIAYNTAQLLRDVSKREVPMNTVVEFSGNIGIWWLKPPLKAAVGYDLKVDPISNEILSQNIDIKGTDF